MKKILVLLLLCSSVHASEIVHQFQSPAFIPGSGYSSHVLTIEQLESQRKQKLKERTEENLREAPIKGLNEELKKKKIDDAKKQCKDIGYKPNSDKFRDCILELM